MEDTDEFDASREPRLLLSPSVTCSSSAMRGRIDGMRRLPERLTCTSGKSDPNITPFADLNEPASVKTVSLSLSAFNKGCGLTSIAAAAVRRVR